MNAWGVTAASVPEQALPTCGHGHEVALLFRFAHGFALVCDVCGVPGSAIEPDELARRGWRLDDIEGAPRSPDARGSDLREAA